MKESARDKIIATGVEMVAISGFNATGIESVLKAAGVPKGSFYHHFGSKENFGIEVINLFAERYAQKLHTFFDERALSRLSAFAIIWSTVLSTSLRRTFPKVA